MRPLEFHVVGKVCCVVVACLFAVEQQERKITRMRMRKIMRKIMIKRNMNIQKKSKSKRKRKIKIIQRERARS